jgi:heme/copper-type cytochrome/quinol oxidase subunit 2
MKFLLAIALVIVVILFGFSSVSQSYASAQQAQAAIEASRTAQIASTGNLIVIVTLVIVLLVAIVVIAYLLHARQPGYRRNFRPNTGPVPQTDMSTLLPAVLTMLLVQAMQKQNHLEADTLFRSRYEDEVALFEDEDTIPWTM